ncbi:signal peptide peptidase SppA [Rheinheimera sp. 1928-s]|uniref:signal peptide peptidase SppA n=1 Tax=Rheinheimera sp. 1928-s TaxID=3033803 RepID=UPI002636946C|nr:signal peptide peptidase SppA [Rheinheimera sp. 1928-s]MDF3126648.1 signal peptide peptidase SppA [Rheinheimera sp. 1928-s]
MSEKKPGILRRFFGGIWRAISLVRHITFNLIFAILFILILVSIFSSDDKVKIPDSAALILNLSGDLVEEKRYIDPLDQVLNEGMGSQEEDPEILVTDLVKTIQAAKKDERIKAIVLDLSSFGRGSMDKLSMVGSALQDFKAAGKKIMATGDYYSQNQYFLASYADSINLNPMGTVLLEGFGSYPMYYKSALEKLKITTHVFKVGTYKSAVEPFTRDTMSDEAKEANKAWLDELWASYKQQVAERRGFAVDNFDETIVGLYQKLQAVNGDMTQYALDAKLVDSIKSREEFRQDLIALVGENEKHSFNQVQFKDYQDVVLPPVHYDNPLTEKVAVVVARGTIIDGSAKAGTIGGDTTAALLRRARFDEKVKAVVLRIDSGGGSAFASEIIGQEIKLLKAAGKPVIASMGAVAASGGYWIAAPANEIWASPTTITGSIGIFGLFHTLENAMPVLGLNIDGVGTSELAGLSSGLPLFKGLTPDMSGIFQLMINKGYDDFIGMVSENRGMSKEAVDKVAQGRVWTGTKALEFGLVDKLGTFDDAIAAAAEKAGLTQYDIKVMEQELTPTEQLLRDMFASSTVQALLPDAKESAFSPLLKNIVTQINQDFKVLEQFNDPKGIYSVCMSCTAVN